uniref:D-isomer specific 2-hydroxyacid dehydrogenase NAD-binding domain-containing protein n=1 Tax=Kalanchoe fedtschenkoi TaxID=63787 RepID=A0A7N0U7Z2_KALFE
MKIVVEQKRLGEPVGDTLQDKTVFILGYGNIGVQLAKRLRPFGVKIVATKRSWGPNIEAHNQINGLMKDNLGDSLDDKKGRREDIYEFARISDIVVDIVDQKFLSSMKKAGFHHLESGHLGGLGIDVAWTEPVDPTDPILKLQNVLINPHVAGVTERSYRSMAKVVGDIALQLHTGSTWTGLQFVN